MQLMTSLLIKQGPVAKHCLRMDYPTGLDGNGNGASKISALALFFSNKKKGFCSSMKKTLEPTGSILLHLAGKRACANLAWLYWSIPDL